MANKFWVGGTGNWNDTTHWATSSGGAGSTGVPATGDNVTIDGHASGLNGGTLTVDVAPNSLASLVMGAMIGTFKNDVGNYNFTLTGGVTAFGNTGAGARTILAGSGTYTITAAGAWDCTTTTNLTNPTTAFASATIVLGATTGLGNSTVFTGGGLTYGTLTLAARPAGSGPINITSANFFTNWNISGPLNLIMLQSATQTITGTITTTGSSSALILIQPASVGSLVSTWALTSPQTLNWVALRNIVATTSSLSAVDSFSLGGNTLNGGSISGPSGGAVGVIGS